MTYLKNTDAIKVGRLLFINNRRHVQVKVVTSNLVKSGISPVQSLNNDKEMVYKMLTFMFRDFFLNRKKRTWFDLGFFLFFLHFISVLSFISYFRTAAAFCIAILRLHMCFIHVYNTRTKLRSPIIYNNFIRFESVA